MKGKYFALFFGFVVLAYGFRNVEEPVPKDIQNLLKKNNCVACHNPYKRIVGPSFLSISKRQYSAEKIAELIANPQPGNWPGFPPMAPIKTVPFDEVKKIAVWINGLK